MDPKLAILRVLAEHSDRDLSIDEIKREMLELGDRLDPVETHSSLVGGDIFRSGLISRDDKGWRITKAGLSILESLDKEATRADLDSSSPSETSVVTLLEQLEEIEQSARWKKGKLGASIEALEVEPSLHSGTGENAEEIGRITSNGESSDNQVTDDKPDVVSATDSPEAVAAYPTAATDIESSPTNAVVVAKIKPRPRWTDKLRLSPLLASLAATRKIVVLQNHELRPAQTVIGNKAKAMGRSAGRLAVFALIGLSVCAVAVALLIELSFFRKENAALQREVSRLRANFSELEQTIKAEKSDSEKNSSAPYGQERRIEQTAFQLSREETQLIRDFIKPAPSYGAVAPNATVGDVVEGTLIPLPSALVEKAPRLAGARFAIRGSNIIIVTRGSNKIDAVLPTN
ncbi:hypothetical protein [Rhodoplanes sp. Z2-YC6860]|uniref:hypothetical protein n=1 Tax=Rhodoplanes sp. Z2-YC6860 TaxID=674703 RepID=UPI00078D30DA|nr:hypothetical protein [Rhodoplanes sp. Z2-YC6860]AMN43690.1 hypothetical protein RHPLAN_52710 [Rhodoplanes sp. Z2-YC6860]